MLGVPAVPHENHSPRSPAGLHPGAQPLDRIIPEPRPHSDTTLSDVSSMYAKVDLSRKHSRPNSDEIDTKKQQDSYTKTLIKKFDLFLQQGGHSQT